MKPETVHRYLSDIRAVINYAVEELPLPGVTNPFNKLEVRTEQLAEDAQPILPGVAEQERVRVLTHASDASSGYGVCWKGLGAV
ncbi:hypothetical protein [Rhizobium sullae]|uniref:Core-binding (CB) domain-containing protein n=1 Tax=Rhizobium sullae TaxID=50338 RepID=A0A4R3QCY7_RHISU|nr:hypothetical protein [Rhizobium sullae]TCU18809.1 hypothetical protein EV132_10236 [Rhizobium sullae]